MSMLSRQADELRETADKLWEHGRFVGFGGNVNVDPLMQDAAIIMREAARTIISLRDRLQDAEAAMNKAAGNWAKADSRLRESYGQVPELVEREDEGERESCGDDRFELIDKAKRKLLECTNIESRPEEVAVLDNILFRCWQMGWLDKLRDNNSRYFELFGTPERAARTLTHECQFTHGGEMCDRCRLYVFNECDGTLRLMSERKIYDALLEWLRG